MATVLLVDDHPSIRLFCRQELEAARYHVVEAGDGHQALAAIGRQRPDVVVLDLRMPRMDGHQTYRRIREIAPDLPVIFFTSHPEEFRSEPDAPPFACLQKSADLTALLGTLRSALGD